MPRIISARVVPLKLDMPVPFRVAYGATTTAEPTLVVLTMDDGSVGLGEGSAISSSTPEQRNALVDWTREVATSLIGCDIEEALNLLSKIQFRLIDEAPTVLAACEIALFDLKAKCARKPLHQLFGAANRRSIATDITLPLLSADETVSFWERYQSYGFRILKVKVKGDIAFDLPHVQRILKMAPKGTQYLLDGNQGFDSNVALKLVDCLIGEGLPKPLFFEQPLPKDDWNGLRDLAAKLPIPLCLDETIATAEDARRAIREKTAPMINLKIMKSGVRETLQIIDVASRAKIPMMIGGMVETEIAMAASLHMLCGTGVIEFADLDTPFFIKDRITRSSPWHANQSELVCSQSLGLGLELLDGM